MTPPVAFERPADRDAELRGRPGEIRFLGVLPILTVMVDGEGQADDDGRAEAGRRYRAQIPRNRSTKRCRHTVWSAAAQTATATATIASSAAPSGWRAKMARPAGRARSTR